MKNMIKNLEQIIQLKLENNKPANRALMGKLTDFGLENKQQISNSQVRIQLLKTLDNIILQNKNQNLISKINRNDYTNSRNYHSMRSNNKISILQKIKKSILNLVLQFKILLIQNSSKISLIKLIAFKVIKFTLVTIIFWGFKYLIISGLVIYGKPAVAQFWPTDLIDIINAYLEGIYCIAGWNMLPTVKLPKIKDLESNRPTNPYGEPSDLPDTTEITKLVIPAILSKLNFKRLDSPVEDSYKLIIKDGRYCGEAFEKLNINTRIALQNDLKNNNSVNFEFDEGLLEI
jgi:hypothetical protein